MDSAPTDPAKAPPGIDPEAWAIAAAAPRIRPEQAERVSAVMARHRADQQDDRVS